MLQLETDAERLMVLDMLDDTTSEATVAYVDDLRARYSSPWALSLAAQAIESAARHLGVVCECGDKVRFMCAPRSRNDFNTELIDAE